MDHPIFYLLLTLGCVVCGYRCIVSKSVLSSALYLAVVSALVSALLYMLGAHQVAVIELSVGAGLVTVLLLYAISVIGDDAEDPPSLIWKPLAVTLVLVGLGLAAYRILPLGERSVPLTTSSMMYSLWEQRTLDVWIQIALIFSGVVGTLGLVAERTIRPARTIAAKGTNAGSAGPQPPALPAEPVVEPVETGPYALQADHQPETEPEPELEAA